MDSIPKLEKLNQEKQADYRRAADVQRQVREARAQQPGLRYRLAQGLITVATRLSPAHRTAWGTLGEEGACPGIPVKNAAR